MGMDWFAIGWAGFVATTLAAAFFWLLRSLGWTRFSPSVQLGCLFFRDHRSPLTETVGFLLLLTLGSTLVPAIYSTLLAQLGGATAPRGFAVGFAHGLVAAALLAPVAAVSPCVRAGDFPAPGRFGLAWGRVTPGGLVLGHALYGAAVAAILEAF